MDRHLLLAEIDRRILEADTKNRERAMSLVRPLIAAVSVGLQSGAIPVNDVIRLLPAGENSDADRKTIEGWAGMLSDE